MSTEGADSEPKGNQICSVSVKVPPFWAEEPALWFSQLEAQFALANITADSTKFYHVISNLDVKYVSEVKDIVINPPTDGTKYEKIKFELIKRLSASQEQKVRQLLAHEELGDRKPSQFLRHLQNLAGPRVPDEFVRSLWASRLPNNIQAIIASQTDCELEKLAQLADNINEVNNLRFMNFRRHPPQHPTIQRWMSYGSQSSTCRGRWLR